MNLWISLNKILIKNFKLKFLSLFFKKINIILIMEYGEEKYVFNNRKLCREIRNN